MSTVFITGGTGFIGRVVVRFARAAGLNLVVTTRSAEAASQLSCDGGVRALVCDLARPGAWQAEAARAEAIIHLAQPPTFGARVTRERALAYRALRMRMDAFLLTSLDKSSVRRVVYVAGTSYYGDVGRSLQDESVTPNPRGWGPYVAPAIETIPLYLARGLPIVQAFPGWVYGDGSWFRDYLLRPLAARKRYFTPSGPARIVSPIHVDDCARAILFLLDRGEIGARYFLVDDHPVESLDLARCAAAALGVPLKTRTAPKLAVRIQAGPVVTESLMCDANLSNARLRALGFQFNFPSIESGIPRVVAEFRERLSEEVAAPFAEGGDSAHHRERTE
ncbi:MAG: NAD-dependent epimerase/dehydratase family protein [Deltaproteobacteria bacterium]|nr:NAD-dependent epimerase/dehydratase family protein [Deltaproteobacteria bacterium]